MIKEKLRKGGVILGELENLLKLLLMVATILSTVAIAFTNIITGIKNLQEMRKNSANKKKTKIKSNETDQRNVAPNNHLIAKQVESLVTFFLFSNLIITYDN